MRITVKAKPKAKTPQIKHLEMGHFEVAVKEPADRGKANKAIVKALASYLKIPASSVHLVSGDTSRQKVFVVPLTEVEMQSLGFN